MRVALASVQNRQATGVDRYATQITAALQAAGVQTRSVVVRRRELRIGPARVGGTASLWLQRLFAGRAGMDLVHALDPAAAARRTDVVTVHDILPEQFPQWLLASRAARVDWSITRRLVRGARVLVASSDATRDEIVRRWGFPAERIVTAPLGVDHALFCPTPGGAPWLAADAPTLVYVGDDHPRKNVLLAVRAVGALAQRHGIRARLVRVGGSRFPDVQAAYQRAAKEAGVDLVEAGYAKDADVVRLLTGAAAFLWPTLGEGFGLPVLEAMACGTPVVALDTPVNREVGGPLARYHADDPDACADGIAEVLSAPPSQEALTAYARQFTWEACARQVLRAYALAQEAR